MMQNLRVLLGAILLIVPLFASAASDIDCDIDTSMQTTLGNLNKATTAQIQNTVGKAIESAPQVKKASCLSVLDDLDQLMRMRIPSVGGAISGILTKVRDMACNMANSYLQSMVDRASVSVGDPYGVVGVSVGATTGQGGSSIEQYDITTVVGEAAMNAGKNVIQGQANQVLNTMPSGPANRTPRIEDSVNTAVNGALNGL
ncbi:TPA: hypothetical protein ACXI4C_004416 [Pseudomonas aeruginosa]